MSTPDPNLVTAKEEKLDKRKQAWSKPAIRVMTIDFTQYGTGRVGTEKSPNDGNFYTPPA